MAVRLDPFRRIVGVEWPAPGLAVNPFRATLTTNYDAGGVLSYSASMQFHGDVTALILVFDQLRVTTSGAPIVPTITAVSFNPATTFLGGVSHPDIATPAGFTTATTPGLVTGARPDVPPDLVEVLRAGLPIVTANVAPWALYTRTVGPFPGASSFRTYFRIAP